MMKIDFHICESIICVLPGLVKVYWLLMVFLLPFPPLFYSFSYSILSKQWALCSLLYQWDITEGNQEWYLLAFLFKGLNPLFRGFQDQFLELLCDLSYLTVQGFAHLSYGNTSFFQLWIEIDVIMFLEVHSTGWLGHQFPTLCEFLKEGTLSALFCLVVGADCLLFNTETAHAQCCQM
jgi:hypothetical protein